MCECELRHWAVSGNSSSSLTNTFLPPRRTVVLDRLVCQTEYCVVFQCRDSDQRKHSSNCISVTTGQSRIGASEQKKFPCRCNAMVKCHLKQ